jgi:hypothetical protein
VWRVAEPECLGGRAEDVMLTIRRGVALLLVSFLSLACSALRPGASPTPQEASGDVSAAAACASVLDDPLQVMLVVQSGKPTVAAAYRVTGEELATYLERRSSPGDSPSVWRDQPDKLVDMCIIDGDLYTQTPGPPGDRSAVRVLVVISDDGPLLWSIARKDKSGLPTTDPSTLE